MWLTLSGSEKKRENSNVNTSSGSYYNEIVKKNRDKSKPLEAFVQIDKVFKVPFGYFLTLKRTCIEHSQNIIRSVRKRKA